jgi:hypothetical protein
MTSHQYAITRALLCWKGKTSWSDWGPRRLRESDTVVFGQGWGCQKALLSHIWGEGEGMSWENPTISHLERGWGIETSLTRVSIEGARVQWTHSATSRLECRYQGPFNFQGCENEEKPRHPGFGAGGEGKGCEGKIRVWEERGCGQSENVLSPLRIDCPPRWAQVLTRMTPVNGRQPTGCNGLCHTTPVP